MMSHFDSLRFRLKLRALVPAGRLPALLLALAGLVAAVVRLNIILRLPDGEADAYGHFGAARALLENPTNLAVHWVWLPGWHYVLWVLLKIGFTFRGVRILNTTLQAFAPFVLHAFVATRPDDPDPDRTRRVAWIAALGWTLASLPNVLATSGQAETLFSIVLLLAAWALDHRHFARGGVLLTAACMMRYEAWGVLAALTFTILVRRRLAALLAMALPAAAITVWTVLRKDVDGAWFAYIHQTHAFVSQFTNDLNRVDTTITFLFRTPRDVIGLPALLLIPIGIVRAVRPGWVVPAGLAGFLLASHLGSGSLDLDRYFTALVPFACVAIAEGALRLGEIIRLPGAIPARSVAVAIAMASLALTAHSRLRTFVASTLEREPQLRAMDLESSRR